MVEHDKKQPWWHRWWGVLILLGVFAIMMRLFQAGSSGASNPYPWSVTITGTPGITLQGGCETFTQDATNSPTINIQLPWTHRYSTQAFLVNCYFQDRQAYGHSHIVIKYNGVPIAHGSGTGAYGIASADATRP